VYLPRRSRPAPFPLGEPGCRLYGWGRQALVAGLRALGLGAGDAVLVPAYHHGSEVEALTALGLECRFYEATDSLEPDPAELEELLDERVRALHLVHYLGFAQDAPRWREWCAERGLLFVEDAAQAWLTRLPQGPAGSFGDLAIFSLYKTVGLPEGAAVVAATPPPEPGIDSRIGVGALARRHGAWLAQRSRLVSTLAARRGGEEEEYDPQRDFELRPHADQPWRSVTLLVRRFDYERVAARRHANYAALLAELRPRVPDPFAELPEGASPLAFPVATDRKAELLEQLARRGVHGLDLWSVPHPTLPVERFPRAAARRASTVCLPVHQELRSRDLELIVEAAMD
jgi:dTDP-4-amino-4,6-dideoxygalactose transaminase